MKLNRRHFIVGAAGLLGARLAVAQDASGVVIIAENTVMPILGRGGKTSTWRFMKDQPVAVLRAKQGQEFKGRIINRLDQDIWLHWFGVRGASTAMTLNVPSGEASAIDFAFTPPDAGTFWFGPMTHASEQRDMGLYGLLIVEEAANATALNDVPLVFDDWLLDGAGQPKGKFGDLEMAIGEGRLGNWFTVNGAFKSKIKIDRAKPTRLRLLNVANARTMSLSFKGADLLLLALDGQPVAPKAVEQGALKLAPGQRADLLLANVKAEIVVALDIFDEPVEVAYLVPEGVAGVSDLPENFALPGNVLSPLGDLTKARVIPIAIEGGAKGGLKSAKMGDQELDLRGLLEKGLAWAFNGIAGAGGPPLFTAQKGETIILAIDNKTSFPQPLHIHGHVWQMVEADGQASEGQPWRDTAVVPGLSIVKLALVADNPGLWVLQSLMAERADAGLLGAFTVASPPP